MSTAAAVLVVVVALWLGQRQLSDLRQVPEGRPVNRRPAEVSIVIPARNEAANLPTLLASLQSTAAEIVVVDDNSTDGTGDIARGSGAMVVRVTAVPPGWTGKAWACHQGVQASSKPTLLFLDADTELAPGALDGLLDLLHDCGGLVSVQPFHRTDKAYEQLSCYFNVVSLMGSGAYARRPPRRPMAFGPCLMTARADYEQAGGHAVVRDQILDDAQLAAAYARAALPVRCFVGGQALRMRMYPAGARQLAEGWTKNIAAGAGQPAVVAQMAATTAILSGGRFTLGVGAGERLNEHVVGAGWPPVSTRHEMLREALEIFRLLWSGGYHSFDGRHLRLEDARVFDLPEVLPQIAVAAGGPSAARIAGELGDAFFVTAPEADLITAYEKAGGHGPKYAEAPLAWAPSADDAAESARKLLRFGVTGWKVQAELPDPVNFDAATTLVTADHMSNQFGCGSDVERHLEVARQFVDAGYDRLALINAGPDMDGFFDFFTTELGPALRSA